MRRRDIAADILYILSDGSIHNMQDIADKLNISRKTVFRHIASLSYFHPIETFHGGNEFNRGGVKLDISKDVTLGALTLEEQKTILDALILIKDMNMHNQNIVQRLITKFNNSINNNHI